MSQLIREILVDLNMTHLVVELGMSPPPRATTTREILESAQGAQLLLNRLAAAGLIYRITGGLRGGEYVEISLFISHQKYACGVPAINEIAKTTGAVVLAAFESAWREGLLNNDE